jgi:parvulin-like peptidyl-prolyl isomerase
MVVNGELIDEAVLRLEAAEVRQQLRREIPEADELALGMQAHQLARERVIDRVLMDQEAKRRGVAPHSLIAQITSTVPRPKPHEVAGYYARFKDEFFRPEMVHAAHIVKNVDETTNEADALSAIRNVMGLLQSGKKFEDVADEHSDCPGQGGDLGFFAPGEMVEEFETEVFALKPGEVSGIFRSPFGFHIARVYERRPAGIPGFREVRNDIEKQLWDHNKQRAVRDVVTELRAKADIRARVA